MALRSVFILLGVFCISPYAHATVLGSQSDFSGSTHSQAGYPTETEYALGSFVPVTTGTYNLYFHLKMGVNSSGAVVSPYIAVGVAPTSGQIDYAYLSSLGGGSVQCTPDMTTAPISVQDENCVTQAPVSVTAGTTYYIFSESPNFAYTPQPIFQLGASGSPYYVVSDSLYTGGASGDGDSSSHVIRINQPVVATTTSTNTVSINFDLNQNLSAPADGYSLTITNAYNGKNVASGDLNQQYGTFATTTAGVQTVATTTYLSSGSYQMTIALCQSVTIIDQTGTSTISPCGGNIDAGKTVTFNVVLNQLPGIPGYDSSATVPQTGGFASSTCAVSFSGTFDLGQCAGYLFVPSSLDISQTYGNTFHIFSGVFPFSYPASIATTWQGLTASSTDNAPVLSYNLRDLNIGSSTALGNILPNVQVFGASTTQQYFPSGTFPLLKGLASTAIYLTFFADVFFTVRNLLHT